MALRKRDFKEVLLDEYNLALLKSTIITTTTTCATILKTMWMLNNDKDNLGSWGGGKFSASTVHQQQANIWWVHESYSWKVNLVNPGPAETEELNCLLYDPVVRVGSKVHHHHRRHLLSHFPNLIVYLWYRKQGILISFLWATWQC